MTDFKQTPWNSLEITKIAIGALTPILIFAFGLQISSSEKERAENAARFERVAENRTKLWESLGPNLNDIYAYTMYVGGWKNWTAAEIIKSKRQADKIFYANRPFFSEKFVEDYERFMSASFLTYNEMGQDAKLRTTPDFRAPEDESAVTGEQNFDEIHTSYYQLLDTLAEEFGLRVNTPKRRQTPVE